CQAHPWPADGTKIAFAAQGAPGLVIADATGGRHPRPVPIATGADTSPLRVVAVKWSPDGSRIAFIAGDEPSDYHLSVVRPDGTALRRVADGGAGFDWSPDSTRLAIEGPEGAGVAV